MHFDLDQRTASLSVGEFADFTPGPRDAPGGPTGLWRAQLGTHWHHQLRDHAAADHPGARFEVPVTGKIFHHGWLLTLTGRIDQILPAPAPAAAAAAPAAPPAVTLREIKTVTRPLPADESELRADYPAYFIQIAAYVELLRTAATVRGELHFVEIASGLAQTIALSPADENRFRAQLERVTEFLDHRHRARERLRHLRFRPPVPAPRPGQETTQAGLAAALAAHPVVFFEAPTGFGKTGALLHLALDRLRAGRFDRVLYLTGKATGQLQVMRTLHAMTAPPAADVAQSGQSASGPERPHPPPPAADAAQRPLSGRDLPVFDSQYPGGRRPAGPPPGAEAPQSKIENLQDRTPA
ncbi:MAG: hypothetical protein LBC18_07695 [Opitutaceae bacterium]|jgi:hypothetical protein|nr:hypothetical protein [Opitutaceae bacterium]